MGGTLRVLTIRGIPINIHVSWLVIYGLITEKERAVEVA